MGQRTNDDREGGREPAVERIPARHHQDDYVYCARHLRMVRQSEGCPKCKSECAREAAE
jgi:hypothetical protein